MDDNKPDYMRLNAEKYLSFSLFNKIRIYHYKSIFLEYKDENKLEYMWLNAEKYLSFSLFNKTRINLSKYIFFRII